MRGVGTHDALKVRRAAPLEGPSRTTLAIIAVAIPMTAMEWEPRV
jgi:hypothetical protein